ncbi:DUF2058 domain-containing protein [Marinibactrum halimedae]|uniref:DUF2058 domain-containing protein n=1 Tax=Marinibactrum halimedae TaxID=1444977 RepID=A0AA37T4N6_9GAMM|nr:DUF2058 domain-containing protein [Marinibactrum halimedae]MCD9458174.1 DUF2058 domain-containing protein [Marinibactrum halimedae]GLS25108.1 hypothetical protein GCM10007877_08220 [Marinibactrum halimedae]
MSKSLQDQLLGAGLVDKKKAKQITKEKKKQKNVERRSKEQSIPEAQQAAEAARLAKQEKDRQLNQQKNAEAERKAIAAQVIQLVQMNRIDKGNGDVEFNFTDDKTIKRILLTAKMSDQVTRGVLCIARLGENYEVIPRPVADKIRERDESTVLVYNTKQALADAPADVDSVEEDSDEAYYAQFEIPDDLMW